jgi:hypothetical protein
VSGVRKGNEAYDEYLCVLAINIAVNPSRSRRREKRKG